MLALLPVNIHLAIHSLNRNRMRSLLTMLGIIIGIAAVLTMIALGTGARGSVEDEVGSAGTKLIFIKAGNYTRGGESVGISAGLGSAKSLTLSDAEAIAENVDGVKAISPRVSVRTTLSHNETRSFAKVQGVSEDIAKTYSWTFSDGEMFSEGSPQAVIGRVLADRLFGTGVSALGKEVDVRGTKFRIVGVIPGEAEDQGEELFTPIASLQKILGTEHLENIVIAAQKSGETSRMADEITTLLRKRHGLLKGGENQSYLGAQGGGAGRPDDFTVETEAAQALTKGLYTPAAAFALANLPKLDEVTLEEMASTLDRASDTMTALLASIAGVSLVVGGIGIMNIMLVSVTERTREIGIRVATGARSSDVAMQFLIEAILLSLTGGIIGLLLGLFSSRLVGWSLGWPVSVSFGAITLAIGISIVVGLVFGIYPARRASLLDPIDALRSE